MVHFTRVLAGAALCVGLGATAAFADTTALDKFPGAKDAIMSYYAANAREGAECGAGHMGNIDEARVVSESADQAVLAVNYVFSAMSQGTGTAGGSGPGPRVHPHQGCLGLGVSSMTGQGP